MTPKTTAPKSERPKGTWLRRVVHMAMGVAPVYYLFPVELPFLGIRRWMLLIAFFAVVAVIEIIRLRLGVVFYGLRPHEKGQVASFAWSAAGITIVLWSFPHDIASVAIVGMALIDPLLGELRMTGIPFPAKLGLPLMAYALIGLVIFAVSGHWSLPQTVLLAVVGAVIAIPSEWYKVAYIDDDFIMMTVPAIGMAWLSLLL